jgi:ribosome-associated translation inhibitor RaiA
MATTRPAEVELSVPDDVPERQLAAVRRHFELLARYADEPLVVHATVRRTHAGQGKRPYIVDAYVVRTGTSRALAAHASAPGAEAAAEKAADRLRRQLRRVVGADVALRNDPRTLQRALADLAPAQPARPRLKPPDEREDVVVHRLDDGEHIGLLHPQGSALADESDEVVVAEPSRYSEPIALETARAEMDLVLHRFLYFIDAGDGRGKVLYPRSDGDYGLVEPE